MFVKYEKPIRLRNTDENAKMIVIVNTVFGTAKTKVYFKGKRVSKEKKKIDSNVLTLIAFMKDDNIKCLKEVYIMYDGYYIFSDRNKPEKGVYTRFVISSSMDTKVSKLMDKQNFKEMKQKGL